MADDFTPIADDFEPVADDFAPIAPTRKSKRRQLADIARANASTGPLSLAELNPLAAMQAASVAPDTTAYGLLEDRPAQHGDSAIGQLLRGTKAVSDTAVGKVQGMVQGAAALGPRLAAQRAERQREGTPSPTQRQMAAGQGQFGLGDAANPFPPDLFKAPTFADRMAEVRADEPGRVIAALESETDTQRRARELSGQLNQETRGASGPALAGVERMSQAYLSELPRAMLLMGLKASPAPGAAVPAGSSYEQMAQQVLPTAERLAGITAATSKGPLVERAFRGELAGGAAVTPLASAQLPGLAAPAGDISLNMLASAVGNEGKYPIESLLSDIGYGALTRSATGASAGTPAEQAAYLQSRLPQHIERAGPSSPRPIPSSEPDFLQPQSPLMRPDVGALSSADLQALLARYPVEGAWPDRPVPPKQGLLPEQKPMPGPQNIVPADQRAVQPGFVMRGAKGPILGPAMRPPEPPPLDVELPGPLMRRPASSGTPEQPLGDLVAGLRAGESLTAPKRKALPPLVSEPEPGTAKSAIPELESDRQAILKQVRQNAREHLMPTEMKPKSAPESKTEHTYDFDSKAEAEAFAADVGKREMDVWTVTRRTNAGYEVVVKPARTGPLTTPSPEPTPSPSGEKPVAGEPAKLDPMAHEKLVHSVLAARKGQTFVYDDAFQQLMTKAQQVAPKYDPAKGTPATFLRPILENELKSMLRTNINAADIRHLSEKAEQAIPARSEPDAGEAMDKAALQADVQKAVADLPAIERKVMDATMQGRTLEDIGAELGVTRQRVQQIAKKARATLAGPLSKWSRAAQSGEAINPAKGIIEAAKAIRNWQPVEKYINEPASAWLKSKMGPTYQKVMERMPRNMKVPWAHNPILKGRIAAIEGKSAEYKQATRKLSEMIGAQVTNTKIERAIDQYLSTGEMPTGILTPAQRATLRSLGTQSDAHWEHIGAELERMGALTRLRGQPTDDIAGVLAPLPLDKYGLPRLSKESTSVLGPVTAAAKKLFGPTKAERARAKRRTTQGQTYAELTASGWMSQKPATKALIGGLQEAELYRKYATLNAVAEHYRNITPKEDWVDFSESGIRLTGEDAKRSPTLAWLRDAKLPKDAVYDLQTAFAAPGHYTRFMRSIQALPRALLTWLNPSRYVRQPIENQLNAFLYDSRMGSDPEFIAYQADYLQKSVRGKLDADPDWQYLKERGVDREVLSQNLSIAGQKPGRLAETKPAQTLKAVYGAPDLAIKYATFKWLKNFRKYGTDRAYSVMEAVTYDFHNTPRFIKQAGVTVPFAPSVLWNFGKVLGHSFVEKPGTFAAKLLAAGTLYAWYRNYALEQADMNEEQRKKMGDLAPSVVQIPLVNPRTGDVLRDKQGQPILVSLSPFVPGPMAGTFTDALTGGKEGEGSRALLQLAPAGTQGAIAAAFDKTPFGTPLHKPEDTAGPTGSYRIKQYKQAVGGYFPGLPQSAMRAYKRATGAPAKQRPISEEIASYALGSTQHVNVTERQRIAVGLIRREMTDLQDTIRSLPYKKASMSDDDFKALIAQVKAKRDELKRRIAELKGAGQ